MTRPRCRRPGCASEVARADRRHTAGRALFRVIGGIRWRNYCSPRCAAIVNHDRMNAARRQHYVSAVRRRLTDEVNAFVAQKFTAADLVRFAWACERRGYQRGYSAAWTQQRRKALA